MKDIGFRANSMVKGHLLKLLVKKEKENGKTEKELDGLMNEINKIYNLYQKFINYTILSIIKNYF